MKTGDAAEWLRHAESDLTYARLGEVQPAILRNQVAFHAEQAAEKALKAYLFTPRSNFQERMICKAYYC